MRKIFEAQTIDMATGEVTKIVSTSMSKNNETFGMYRTTTGIEWVVEFQGREMQLLMVLLHFEDIKTRIIPLSSLTRQTILDLFKITKSTLSNMLKSMESKRLLIRLSTTDILLNPSFFYKGSSSDIKNRIEEFCNECDKKEGNRKSLINSGLQEG